MEPTKQSKRLGSLVHKARTTAGLSLNKLAETIELVDRGYLWKLERGLILKPAPAILDRLAEALSIELADLYALAGYPQPKGLPDFQPYLRAKYQLSDAAIRELQQHFDAVTKQSPPKRGRS